MIDARFLRQSLKRGPSTKEKPMMGTKILWVSMAFGLSFVLAAPACEKSSEEQGDSTAPAVPATAENTEVKVAAPGAVFAQSNQPENLKKLMETLQGAIRASDIDKAAALTQGLIPDNASAAKALKEGTDQATVAKAIKMYERMPPNKEQMATALRTDPARTKVSVWSATPEELMAYTKGSDAYNEFPGGARDIAGFLRPGLAFYEVEVTEPEKSSGMKFHMFFWDGAAWKMLGPAWRTLKK